MMTLGINLGEVRMRAELRATLNVPVPTLCAVSLGTMECQNKGSSESMGEDACCRRQRQRERLLVIGG